MDKEQIEKIIEDYIKENLTVWITEKNGWEGEKYFQIKVCLGNEVIHTTAT